MWCLLSWDIMTCCRGRTADAVGQASVERAWIGILKGVSVSFSCSTPDHSDVLSSKWDIFFSNMTAATAACWSDARHIMSWVVFYLETQSFISFSFLNPRSSCSSSSMELSDGDLPKWAAVCFSLESTASTAFTSSPLRTARFSMWAKQGTWISPKLRMVFT